jgi:hypothetical protein
LRGAFFGRIYICGALARPADSKPTSNPCRDLGPVSRDNTRVNAPNEANPLTIARLHKTMAALKLQSIPRRMRDLTSLEERQEVEGKAELTRKMPAPAKMRPGFLPAMSLTICPERASDVRAVCRQPLPLNHRPATCASEAPDSGCHVHA